MKYEVNNNTVLLVDDDETTALALIKALKRRESSLNYIYAATELKALTQLKVTAAQVVILDLSLDNNLGPESGLNLIGKLLQVDSNLRILVLTGHSDDKFGIQALNNGAASFLTKPANPDHLLALIRDALKFAKLKKSYSELAQSVTLKLDYPGLFYKDRAMREVVETIEYATSNALPVLILGETGTGKGLVAQAIFENQKHHRKNFVVCYPNFVSGDLINSELFGHRKGAFTGAIDVRKGLIEEANNGTLFIDEIAELPLETQLTILRVLQEKKFRAVGTNQEIVSDFRLISATNKDITKRIATEKFRLDLYHRISHILIQLPPLRERKEDIIPLAEFFVRNLTLKENLLVHGFSLAAISRLQHQDWLGNVRELKACIEAAVYYANFKGHRIIEVEDLRLGGTDLNPSTALAPAKFADFRSTVKQYELKLIQTALDKFDNNQSQAARYLNLDRSSMLRILNSAK
ncbi:MAG: sigma-54 dependent transcriptional regulator [Deltaproteobacteria bacterium]|jgi:two-component system NtrC family response regulator|nr:sigma-54 dependent transcriptional regulator [Deltaproteobacteria bacterium]